MTQVNENGSSIADQVRRGPGNRASDIGESARAPAPGGAGRPRGGDGAFRHPAGRAGGPGTARCHDSGRTGRAREGAAAVHDQGHRGASGSRAGDQGSAPDRRPSGQADGHRAGAGAGAADAQAPGGVAGAAAAGAEPRGARDAAGGGADPAAAQPVLAGKPDPAEPPSGPAAAPQTRKPRPGGRMFGSLRNRNYRLFATGQVISNTGSWMQRIAQDWLVLDLTHNSGAALGITTGLQFAPMLLSMWGGAVADRYSKRRILMVTQALMGALALLLGVLAATGAVQIWHVYVLALALGIITAVDNP